MGTDSRPSLRMLCLEYGVTILDLARASNRHPLLIWDMLVGNPVSREEAHMILCGFNSLRATSFTLDELRISLSIDDGNRFHS